MIIEMTAGHRMVGENFQFRDWTPVAEGQSLHGPRAGTLLSYRRGSDSPNLPKCSQLLPVQVPVRVLTLEESTNPVKLILLRTQT